MIAYNELIGILLASTPESGYSAFGHQKSLTSGQDWQDLYHLAQRQRIATPLYAELQEHGVPLPPEVVTLFKIDQRRTTLSNLRLYASLRRLSDILGKAGIPFILLKGSHLARAVYPSIALRAIGDRSAIAPGTT